MTNDHNVSWPGWEVVRTIGHGSFGAVYEIQRNTFGHIESAALKVITIPDKASDIEDLYNDGYTVEDVTMRFQGYLEDIIREYSLMVDMKGHSNVVYCDDFRYVQHEDGIGWDIYIKMELLTPLTKALAKEIDERQVMDLGIDICSALVMCRERNIVHRDIKPQNIFVSKDGTYKLGDFGIAKTAERTTSGTKIGTYKYMAPEVYNNQPYGSGADIYSLGLLMYWMLNERRTPFLPLPPQVPSSSMEDEARKRRFLGEEIPAPVHGSEDLKAIVLKACAYDPKERFASAADMRDALLRLRDGAAVVIGAGVAAAAAAGAATEKGTQSDGMQEILEIVCSDAGTGAVIFSASADETGGTPESADAPEGHTAPESDTAPEVTAEEEKTTDHSAEKAEPKKRKPILWIVLAAMLTLVIGAGIMMGGGQKPPVVSDDTSTDEQTEQDQTTEGKNEQADTADKTDTQDKNDQQSSVPVQLDWTDWASKLPDGVTEADYEIEKQVLYRSRQLEKTTSSQKTLDGWECYDSATSGSWGAWTEWSESAVNGSDTRQVETQLRYRYRDKVTKSTSSQTGMDGWTLYNTTYTWGPYGSWSSWSTTAATASDSRKVEKRTEYRVGSITKKESTKTSLDGYTRTGSYWGSSESATVYYASFPSGFSTSHSLYSKYNNSAKKSGETSTTKTVAGNATVYGYIYYHWCRNYQGHGGSMNRQVRPWKEGDFSGFHAFFSKNSPSNYTHSNSGDGDCYTYSNKDCCSDTYWYYVTTVYAQSYTTQKKMYTYEKVTWSDWSSQSAAATSTTKVETRTTYRYCDREKVPTYHYERWSAWSGWSTSAVSQTTSKQVQTTNFYRYRDKATEKTYYFRRWTAWSDYSTKAVSASDSVQVETVTRYRYRSKQS